jgi:5'-methylthioadenosine phosphorylase/purine-nucleoside phosphorylase
MGGASAAIYYEELIQLGAKRLVRVGTVGGLDPALGMGETILAISATPDDPMVEQLLSGEAHAPTASWALIAAAVRIASEEGVSLHPGAVVSSALFYDERAGIMERWRDRGHLGVEMEVATLYTIAALRTVEAVALTTVSDLIFATGNTLRISDEALAEGVHKMMRVACRVAVS